MKFRAALRAPRGGPPRQRKLPEGETALAAATQRADPLSSYPKTISGPSRSGPARPEGYFETCSKETLDVLKARLFPRSAARVHPDRDLDRCWDHLASGQPVSRGGPKCPKAHQDFRSPGPGSIAVRSAGALRPG